MSNTQPVTLTDFYAMYREGQVAAFQRRFSAVVSDEGLESLARTFCTLKLFLPDEDIEPYMGYVMRWARSRGIRADHRLLRSTKLLTAFIRRTNRQDRYGFTNVEAMREQLLLRNRTFADELTALVLKVKAVYQVTGQDLAFAFLLALDSRHWQYYDKLASLCRKVLQGDSASVNIMKEKGLYETV
jgi:hypothetical protein